MMMKTKIKKLILYILWRENFQKINSMTTKIKKSKNEFTQNLWN